MTKIGTPLSETATKVLLCGSGELGKEVAIEFQRVGVEVIAVNRYPNAPAMQVAHRSYVISMLDPKALREVIEKEQPHFIVPEVEAISTVTLLALEKEGYPVIPCARATRLTMDREGIRRLAAVDFDYEITLLTIKHRDGTCFCEPIGHRQESGDYRESWQPHPMSPDALADAQCMAAQVTGALGGHGIFGVEFFVKNDEVYFSELSPRPHDTGMVTMISQDLSEFALHTRAILGLPIPNIRQHGPSASAVILVEGDSDHVEFGNLYDALKEPDTQIRLFGKPEVHGERRMGVALARGETIEQALKKAKAVAKSVTITL